MRSGPGCLNSIPRSISGFRAGWDGADLFTAAGVACDERPTRWRVGAHHGFILCNLLEVGQCAPVGLLRREVLEARMRPLRVEPVDVAPDVADSGEDGLPFRFMPGTDSGACRAGGVKRGLHCHTDVEACQRSRPRATGLLFTVRCFRIDSPLSARR